MRILLIFLCFFTVSCNDLRDFSGKWEGEIIKSEDLRAGFSKDTTVEVEIHELNRFKIKATILSPEAILNGVELDTVPKWTGDTIESISFDSQPLRTYLLYGSIQATERQRDLSAFISLFQDGRIELRLFSGNRFYGVFPLRQID